MYAYTNKDINICRLTGFSLAFISSPSINNSNSINSINDIEQSRGMWEVIIDNLLCQYISVKCVYIRQLKECITLSL